jgi:hypothetical protein
MDGSSSRHDLRHGTSVASVVYLPCGSQNQVWSSLWAHREVRVGHYGRGGTVGPHRSSTCGDGSCGLAHAELGLGYTGWGATISPAVREKVTQPCRNSPTSR